MAIISLLTAALTVVLGRNTAPRESGEFTTLTKFIDSMHWDPAKSGVLLAIDTDMVYADGSDATSLAGFKRKLVKVGKASAIIQTWSVGFGDEDIPNAYDSLSNDDKIAFLIATLRPGELKALFTDGLCGRDLSGQQRQALLSMLPKNFTYLEGETHGPAGFRGDSEMKVLPDDQRDRVRLQIHKCLSLSFAPTTNSRGGQSTQGVSSVNYRGPNGTRIVRSGELPIFSGPRVPGRIVDNEEKKSDLSWRDPRLAKAIDLSVKTTIGGAVDAIRSLTGVEVYADCRIAGCTFSALGASCSAGDLLHAISWALCGVVRKVGSAYVLTANIEGKESRETRLAAIGAEGQISIQPDVAAWRRAAYRAEIYASMPISAEDSFGIGSNVASLVPSADAKFMDGWVSLSQLPQSAKTAVSAAQDQIKENADYRAAYIAQHPEMRQPSQNDNWTPVGGLDGKVKLAYNFGYRFVLPDGRPLEYRPFVNSAGFQGSFTGPTPKDIFPIDAKVLKPGGGIAIKSDDPRSVASMCALLKQFGVDEVWLETDTADAIKAAIDAGLLVDLVVRPWKLLKGEACADPDRNVIGQTGSRLATVPGVRVNPYSRKVRALSDSISPTDPGLTAHWSRLATLASTKGVARVILMDTEPPGYQSNPMIFPGAVFSRGRDGSQISPGLPNLAPMLYQFGYTIGQRVEFLRAHKIDPIDILSTNSTPIGPVDPYFDPPTGTGPFSTTYPGVFFPVTTFRPPRNPELGTDWHTYLHDRFMKGFAAAGLSLSQNGAPILMEGFAGENQVPDISGIRSVAPYSADGKLDWSNAPAIVVPFNPSNAEDDDGKIVYQPGFGPPKNRAICYDLTEVPPDRLSLYLRFLLKPANK